MIANIIFAFWNIFFYNENIIFQKGNNAMISFKPLWRTLLDRDMTKTQFREAVGIGTAQLAKMGKNEYVSLEVIDKICDYLDVQPGDIIEHLREERQDDKVQDNK
jgi:DNA-binding Xre family transcriptional regulator